MTPAHLPSTLYLHGGSGMNAAVERAWFPDKESVHWWDQPRFSSDAPAAFEATLAAATKQLSYLHDRLGQPIHLIGWSFGTRLALELAAAQPARVGRLTLLAPTLILREAIPRLAERLIAAGVGGPELKTALDQARILAHHDALLALATTVLSLPDILDRYWAPGAQTAGLRYRQLAAQTHGFDTATFAAVSRDLFDRPLPMPDLAGKPVHIFAGRHDLYFDGPADIPVLHRRFPGAEIHLVETGHMLPFEYPVEKWLKA